MLETKSMFDRSINTTRRLREARAGSKEALGQILADYRAYLLLIAGQELDPILRVKAGASDVVQDTIHEAYRDFGNFHGETERALLVWLRRLLLNNLADLRRRYGENSKRDVNLEIAFTAAGPAADPWLAVGNGDSSPSARAIKHEQIEAMYRAIDALPDDYQQVILYRYQEGLPFDAIGRLMNRTDNAVEKLWARAIACLRLALEKSA
jgi:RNA polymerase sigma-70 factor, ECF subfamily